MENTKHEFISVEDYKGEISLGTTIYFKQTYPDLKYFPIGKLKKMGSKSILLEDDVKEFETNKWSVYITL